MIKRLLKRWLSQSSRVAIRRWGRHIRYYGWNRYCPVCQSCTKEFKPHGIPPAPDAVCHICLSKAPHRLAGLLFQEYQEQLFYKQGTCIHIAPEPELSRQLKFQCKQTGMQYRYGGLHGDGEYFNLLDLSLEDQSVSLLYCCHVINAIIDDRKAIAEAYRVISKQGVAVLQVPAYCTDEKTKEAIREDDSERLKAFFDPDIYRCYTDIDYRNRLSDAGFYVLSFESSFFSNANRMKMGLHGEVVHLGFRDANHPLAQLLVIKQKKLAVSH